MRHIARTLVLVVALAVAGSAVVGQEEHAGQSHREGHCESAGQLVARGVAQGRRHDVRRGQQHREDWLAGCWFGGVGQISH